MATEVRARKREKQKILGDTNTDCKAYVVTTDPNAIPEAELLQVLREKGTKVLDKHDKLYASRSIKELNGDNVAIEPPLNFNLLAGLPYKNNILKQCIDIYADNIDGLGHKLVYTGPEGEQESPEALAEYERLEELLYEPDGEHSVGELRRIFQIDLRTIGAGFYEVNREYNVRQKERRIVSFCTVPAETVRKTTRDSKPTEVTYWVKRDGQLVQQKRERHFRRYMQKVGSQVVYFKEFGDPRSIDPKTGKVNNNLLPTDEATEIVELSDHCGLSVYGMPTHINQLPSLLGSREAEELNYKFFDNDGIPYMVVTVSGGSLSQEAVNNIRAAFAKHANTKGNQVLILEAPATKSSTIDDSRMQSNKIEIKPFGKDKIQDELYQEYDKNCSRRVRSSYRLPEIMFGISAEYNRATSFAAMSMVESQVFAPQRKRVDDLFNRVLLVDAQGRPPQYWAFESNGLKLVHQEDRIEAFKAVKDTEMFSYNQVVEFINEVFNKDYDTRDEPWASMPLFFVKKFFENGLLVDNDLDTLIEDLEAEAEISTEDNEVELEGQEKGNYKRKPKKKKKLGKK